jgi:hypothetical protein
MIGKIALVSVNIFFKKNICSHVIVIAVGLRSVTIPENCKYVNIGNLKKKRKC